MYGDNPLDYDSQTMYYDMDRGIIWLHDDFDDVDHSDENSEPFQKGFVIDRDTYYESIYGQAWQIKKAYEAKFGPKPNFNQEG